MRISLLGWVTLGGSSLEGVDKRSSWSNDSALDLTGDKYCRLPSGGLRSSPKSPGTVCGLVSSSMSNKNWDIFALKLFFLLWPLERWNKKKWTRKKGTRWLNSRNSEAKKRRNYILILFRFALLTKSGHTERCQRQEDGSLSKRPCSAVGFRC